MQRGGTFFATAAILTLSGCGGAQPQLQIRPLPAPLSATAKPVTFRIAEAHAHLALGNVALALESYRKALREQPDSVDAMVGLATCYDRMARFDLSRRYYESALAVVPADTRILNALARSLDVQGRSMEAAAVRSEIRTRSAAAEPPPAPAIQAEARSQTVARASRPVAARSVTIALPPPKLIATISTPRPAEPEARSLAPPAKLGPKVAAVPAPPPAPVAVARKPVEPTAVPAPAAPAPIVAFPKPVELAAVAPPPPPAAPITARPVEAPTMPPRPPSARVALAQETSPAQWSETQAGPRLERLSLGEVVLITTDRPQWRSEVVSRTAQSTTVRFVPLRKADAPPVRIRLLNAARHEGLAARTRQVLVQRGWRQLAIGNARQVRQSSLVLYPANQRTLAKRLAAQFGIALAENADGTDLIVLLGRDAARYPARGG